jgi:mRNA interferase HicA
VLKRTGGGHDIYFNPTTKRSAPIPRHPEIPDTLCKLIERQLGVGGSSLLFPPVPGTRRLPGNLGKYLDLLENCSERRGRTRRKSSKRVHDGEPLLFPNGSLGISRFAGIYSEHPLWIRTFTAKRPRNVRDACLDRRSTCYPVLTLTLFDRECVDRKVQVNFLIARRSGRRRK